MKRYSVHIVKGESQKRVRMCGEDRFDSETAFGISEQEVQSRRRDKDDSIVFIRDEFSGDIIWKCEIKVSEGYRVTEIY